MNLIHPRILISTSLISLALLLASATPIPTFDVVVPRADGNSLIAKDSPALSALQAPSLTQLFPRHDLSLDKKLLNLIREILDGHEASSNPPDQNFKEALVFQINELEMLITKPRERIDETVGHAVSRRISHIRVWVSTWQLDKSKEAAVKGIEGCEAEMVKNNFTRDHTAATMEELLNTIENQLNDITIGISWKVSRFHGLFTYVTDLTLKEQGQHRETLKNRVEKFGTMINKWPKAEKEAAESCLEGLRELDSLLDVWTE